jgi:hypothetical protein
VTIYRTAIRVRASASPQAIREAIRAAALAIADELSAADPQHDASPAPDLLLTVTAATGSEIDLPGVADPHAATPAATTALLQSTADAHTDRAVVCRGQRYLTQAASAHGWRLVRRCYPDALLIHPESGAIACVVSALSRGRQLRRRQYATLCALAAYGVPCYRYDPDTGFARVGIPTPAANLRPDVRLQIQGQL